MTDFEVPEDVTSSSAAAEAPRADEQASDVEALPDWATISEPVETDDVDLDILRVEGAPEDTAEEIVELEELDEVSEPVLPDLANAELLDVVEVETEDGEVVVAPREPSPYDRPGDWFVVHTYAGY